MPHVWTGNLITPTGAKVVILLVLETRVFCVGNVNVYNRTRCTDPLQSCGVSGEVAFDWSPWIGNHSTCPKFAFPLTSTTHLKGFPSIECQEQLSNNFLKKQQKDLTPPSTRKR
eukprot:1194528-Prorocentrum_minimum.AAC.12